MEGGPSLHISIYIYIYILRYELDYYKLDIHPCNVFNGAQAKIDNCKNTATIFVKDERAKNKKTKKLVTVKDRLNWTIILGDSSCLTCGILYCFKLCNCCD